MKQYEEMARIRVREALAQGLRSQAVHRLLTGDHAPSAPARRSVVSRVAHLLFVGAMVAGTLFLLARLV